MFERQRDTERVFSSTGSLSKCRQQPGLGCTRDRARNSIPVSHTGARNLTTGAIIVVSWGLAALAGRQSQEPKLISNPRFFDVRGHLNWHLNPEAKHLPHEWLSSSSIWDHIFLQREDKYSLNCTYYCRLHIFSEVNLTRLYSSLW